MKNKRITLTVLISILVCSGLLIGCSAGKAAKEETSGVVATMEKEEVPEFNFGLDGDVMPIYGYYGPIASYINRDGNTLPDYITDEYFKMIADVGINLITHSDVDYTGYSDLVNKSLDLCEKYGIGYMVKDSKILEYANREDITAAEVGERLAEYADHPAFSGVFLVDEPRSQYWQPGDGSKLLPKYENIMNIFQNDLDVVGYHSPFPIWDMDKAKNKENYEKYIAEYFEYLHPQFITIAHYPFYPEQYPDTDDIAEYFYNVSLIRDYTNKDNVPFIGTVQAGSQWNDEKQIFDSVTPYYPSEGQFNWNAHTLLAMGSRGIGYFPILQPEHFAWAESAEWDSQRNGLIGALGNKTMWYNFAQNVNKQVAAIDEVLMNAAHKGIVVNGERTEKETKYIECKIKSGQFQQLQSLTGEAIVGCFNYQGKTALYVVNNDMEYAQKVTLHLNEACNMRLIQNAESSYVNAKNLTLDMAAGEGVLVVIE